MNTSRSQKSQATAILVITVLSVLIISTFWGEIRKPITRITKSYKPTDFRRSTSEAMYRSRNPAKRYVVAVSIDGLRASVISQLGFQKLPHIARFIREGASTLNARSDAHVTLTLPNHTCMLTGRGVAGPQGHGYNRNRLPAKTLHRQKGHYIASVFDTLHDHGYRTALFASKRKFVLYPWSYSEAEGAMSQSGSLQGRNKIDEVQIVERDRETMQRVLQTLKDPRCPHFLFVHLRGPDTKGHRYRWESRAYLEEVAQQDRHLGQLLETIETTPHLRGKTTLIVTTDHGGTLYGHRNPRVLLHYRIPFFVWGHSVQPGTDLYHLNPNGYQDPGKNHVDYVATKQPIRNGNLANLVTQLFGLPAVSGSTIGVRYPLRIHPPKIRPTNSSKTQPTSSPATQRTNSWN